MINHTVLALKEEKESTFSVMWLTKVGFLTDDSQKSTNRNRQWEEDEAID